MDDIHLLFRTRSCLRHLLTRLPSLLGMKKRATVNCMDEELRDARATNGELKRQHLALRDQLSRWRMLALQHVTGEDGCQCIAIKRYNNTLMSEIMLGVERAERDMAAAQMQDTMAF